jgi:hypothetical protein
MHHSVWRRRSPARTAAAGAALCLATALLVIACSQGEGDRCEVDSDCAAGLRCDQPQGGNGQCRPAGTNTPRLDAAPTSDLAPRPADAPPPAPDQAPPPAPDAAAPDLPPPVTDAAADGPPAVTPDGA